MIEKRDFILDVFSRIYWREELDTVCGEQIEEILIEMLDGEENREKYATDEEVEQILEKITTEYV